MEDRLRRLERRSRFQAGIIVALATLGLAAAAAPSDQKITAQEIILKHPDGGSTITLRASPDISGIWIGDKATDRAVALYKDRKDAVVGVYSGNAPVMDCAFAVTEGGPVLQLANQTRRIVLNANNWQPQATPLPVQEIRFTQP